MQLDRKIQLIGIFLLSGFVCIASTYRTVIVKRLSHTDATWADVDPAIWAVVENAVGIVSASLPTMRPVYVWLTRGHYCNAIDTRYCDTCSKKTRKESGNGSASEDKAQWRPTGSCSSESAIVEKGGSNVSTVEMC